jgi:hypothetical protein
LLLTRASCLEYLMMILAFSQNMSSWQVWPSSSHLETSFLCLRF